MTPHRVHRVVVIGLGRFGRAAALALADLGVEVTAIDSEMRLVEELKDLVGVAVALDATQIAPMRDLAADKADAWIVGVGENFEVNVLMTTMGREMGVPVIITRARGPLQRRVLEHVGATRVLYPEQEAGQRLARALVFGDILDFINLPDDYSLRELPVPSAWQGHSLSELSLRQKHKMSVLVVSRPSPAGQGRISYPIPAGDFRLAAGDRLSIIAANEVFDRLD